MLKVRQGYGGARLSKTALAGGAAGIVSLVRLVAGLAGWDLPLSDAELLAMVGALISVAQVFMRRGIDEAAAGGGR
jgi:hypothetical protein